MESDTLRPLKRNLYRSVVEISIFSIYFPPLFFLILGITGNPKRREQRASFFENGKIYCILFLMENSYITKRFHETNNFSWKEETILKRSLKYN